MMKPKKTSVYLRPDAAAVLDKLVEESGESQSAIVNSAIIFFADRGEYMKELIKRACREALNE
jgi:predicted transcriptional regulator